MYSELLLVFHVITVHSAFIVMFDVPVVMTACPYCSGSSSSISLAVRNSKEECQQTVYFYIISEIVIIR